MKERGVKWLGPLKCETIVVLCSAVHSEQFTCCHTPTENIDLQNNCITAEIV